MRSIDQTKTHLTLGRKMYQDCLDQWAATVSEQPTSALATMTDIFGLAARIELADNVLNLVEFGEADGKTTLEVRYEIEQELQRKLITRGRSQANYSTNPCSNLLEDSRTEALADFLHWFQN
jgi:hypothetical protein